MRTGNTGSSASGARAQTPGQSVSYQWRRALKIGAVRSHAWTLKKKKNTYKKYLDVLPDIRWLRFQTTTFTLGSYVVRVCMCLCQEIMVYGTEYNLNLCCCFSHLSIYLFRYVALYLLLSLVFLFIYNYLILKPINCPLTVWKWVTSSRAWSKVKAAWTSNQLRWTHKTRIECVYRNFHAFIQYNSVQADVHSLLQDVILSAVPYLSFLTNMYVLYSCSSEEQAEFKL